MLILNLTAISGGAQDWVTKGGNSMRQSYSEDRLGFFGMEYWRMENVRNKDGQVIGPGQSATQPIEVDGHAYHLAGEWLWKIDLASGQGTPQWEVAGTSKPNRNPRTDAVVVSSSTPTYSPESGMIYFGTGYGYLWAYNPETDAMHSYEVSGCPVVSSPLVLRIDNRDIVIIGDKDDGCDSGTGGKVWAVWGMDGLSPQPDKALLEVGGWVTSSPVPAADDTFIIGADGIACYNQQGQLEGYGKVLKVKVVKNGTRFKLTPADWQKTPCTKHGQAGNFVATDNTVHWVDVNGQLYTRIKKDGTIPDLWPASVDLPARIGGPGSKGFTNTEPAIDTEGDAIYVTLRNFKAPTDNISLRGCGLDYPKAGCTQTGAPGAVAALRLSTGETIWTRRMEIGPDPDRYDSINTAPLVLKSRHALIFGDVNGQVHSLGLHNGYRWPFMLDETCTSQDAINLLGPGEAPDRGKTTWSQVSGVGTDPMITGGDNPLMLMGVNIAGGDEDNSWRYGRLVAIRAGDYYNLTWAGHSLSTEGQTITVNAKVTLQFGKQSLGQMRDIPVPIHWFVVHDDHATDGRLAGTTATLPDGLTKGDTADIATTIQLLPEDPDEGFLLGVIDLPTLARFGSPDDLAIRKLNEVAGLASSPCPGQTATELVFSVDGISQAEAYGDNYVWIPYKKQNATNIKVAVDAPAAVAWDPDGTYTATVRITNDGLAAARVPVTIRNRTASGQDYVAGTLTVDVAPGATITRTRQIPIFQCGDTSTVTAVANPEPRAFPETAYTDNADAATTTVGDCGAGETGDTGDDLTVIVPADCIPNPDMESPKPCLNYDLTIPGR